MKAVLIDTSCRPDDLDLYAIDAPGSLAPGETNEAAGVER